MPQLRRHLLADLFRETRRRAIQTAMRIIDVTHWLDEHGHIPTDNLRSRRQVLRVKTGTLEAFGAARVDRDGVIGRSHQLDLCLELAAHVGS